MIKVYLKFIRIKIMNQNTCDIFLLFSAARLQLVVRPTNVPTLCRQTQLFPMAAITSVQLALTLNPKALELWI